MGRDAKLGQPHWLAVPPHAWTEGSLDRRALARDALELRREKYFPAAATLFAAKILETYQSSFALNLVMREHARFAFLAFAMFLDHQRKSGEPGITYSGLVALFDAGSKTSAGRLATPTRVKAMLGIARVGGQLEQINAAHGDRRRRILIPTEKLTAPALQWLRGALEAAAFARPLEIEPAAMVALPGMLAEVLSYNVSAYLYDHFTLHEEFPIVRNFMRRDNGYLVLMNIIHTLRTEGRTWIAAAPAQELSERFKSSRGTVRNVLSASKTSGFLNDVSRGGHRIELSDAFVEECQSWVAHEIVWMAGLANAAARRLRDQRS